MNTIGHLINGEVRLDDNRTQDVFNPATGKVEKWVALASKATVEEAIAAAEAALTPAELAIAERVYVGNLPCELGAFVRVTRDPASPGYFDVQVRDLKYRMSPVATTTGAIRLEDQKAGAVWLQILNKSMLMNHKLGQRLADECMGVEQQAINDTLKKNPARSVLEPALPTDAK